MKEIETRANISNPVQILKRLSQNNFIEKKESIQHDIMFDYPDGKLFKSGQKIRIRIEDGKSEITYKGGFEATEMVSKRTELNISISSSEVDNFKLFLSSIGFPILFEIKKKRREFIKGDLKITFDEWPIIGTLIEIEGITEKSILECKSLIAPDVNFRNFRLKELFEEKMKATGMTLNQLVENYELTADYKLGNIGFIL